MRLPEGWTREKLSDITKEKISYGIVQAGSHIEDGVPYIKSSNVGGKIDLNQLQRTSQEIHHKYRRSAVHPNDIVFSLRGNIGQLSIVPEEISEANLTQGTARISIDDKNDTLFVYHQMKSSFVLNRVNELSKGSAFKEISLEELRKVSIPIPPLPEQQKIAQILTTWDKAIEKLEALIAPKQTRKKALMQQLLTGKVRFVGFSDEWKEFSISAIGKVVTGSTPPKISEENYGGSISWATAEDFKGKFVKDTAIKLSEEGASKARLLPKGSVLVTCIASIGKNAIANEVMATNQQINSVVVNQNHNNEFFYYLIEFFKNKLVAFAGITAVPILNKTTFEKIEFLMPELKEQQKIAAVLSASDNEIQIHQHELAALKLQKKGLMQQLLTGKVRVKVEAVV